jgi:adenylate cyclase
LFAEMSPYWQVRAALGAGLTLSNLLGIVVVFVLALWVVPLPSEGDTVTSARSLGIGVLLALVGGIIGTWQALRVLRPVVMMLRPGDDPDDEQRRKVLSAPRRIFLFQALLWALASVVVGVVNGLESVPLGVAVGLIVALAGWTTSCITFLLCERALRPVARRVLASGIPTRRNVRSVASRTMFAWGLGTGVAVLGLTLVGLAGLLGPDVEVTTRQMSITMLALGVLILGSGAVSTYLSAQASSEPIRALREAVERVGEGDYSVRVPIYDGTEIGLLQVGFNQMVEGLQEKEDLRDLFGRHVGEDVARVALDRGIELGGEVRDISVLFVDVIGSTSLAENCEPEEVVALLNQFFDVVIDVVHEHGGFINKFEGDAALAVWGAPVTLSDVHTCSLQAARVMSRRLREEVRDIRASIGVSCGRAVAGNVGTHERYEYTVIGDPVNEAARLTTAAKDTDRLVLVNQALVEASAAEEARHWCELEPIQVRGRSEPTRIATPCGG